MPDLSAAQQSALRQLDAHPAYRVRNGWRFKGGGRCQRGTANALFQLGMVQPVDSRLTITDAGRRFLADPASWRPDTKPAAGRGPGSAAVTTTKASPRGRSRPRIVPALPPHDRRWWLT